jgi:hypothetical protein
MNDRPVSISLYPPHPNGRPTHETGAAVRVETTVSELITGLLTPDLCESKHLAPAWSPIAYLGARRVASEAQSICALVYDLDHSDQPSDAHPRDAGLQ